MIPEMLLISRCIAYTCMQVFEQLLKLRVTDREFPNKI